MNIQQIVQNQRNFFNTHATKDLDTREKALRNILKWIQTNEKNNTYRKQC